MHVNLTTNEAYRVDSTQVFARRYSSWHAKPRKFNVLFVRFTRLAKSCKNYTIGTYLTRVLLEIISAGKLHDVIKIKVPVTKSKLYGTDNS